MENIELHGNIGTIHTSQALAAGDKLEAKSLPQKRLIWFCIYRPRSSESLESSRRVLGGSGGILNLLWDLGVLVLLLCSLPL